MRISICSLPKARLAPARLDPSNATGSRSGRRFSTLHALNTAQQYFIGGTPGQASAAGASATGDLTSVRYFVSLEMKCRSSTSYFERLVRASKSVRHLAIIVFRLDTDAVAHWLIHRAPSVAGRRRRTCINDEVDTSCLTSTRRVAAAKTSTDGGYGAILRLCRFEVGRHLRGTTVTARNGHLRVPTSAKQNEVFSFARYSEVCVGLLLINSWAPLQAFV